MITRSCECCDQLRAKAEFLEELVKEEAKARWGDLGMALLCGFCFGVIVALAIVCKP